MVKRMNHWEAWLAFPPYYVRLLAKRGARGIALSDAEIAISSGIDINRVREIKCLTAWDTVTHREMLGFTMACNFDPTNQKHRARAKCYEQACKTRNSLPFQYLRIHPKFESEFLPLIRILKEQLLQSSVA